MTPNKLLAHSIELGGIQYTLLYNNRAFAIAEHKLKRKFIGPGAEAFWGGLSMNESEMATEQDDEETKARKNEQWAQRLMSTPGISMEIATLIWIGLQHMANKFSTPDRLFDHGLDHVNCYEHFATAMKALEAFFPQLDPAQAVKEAAASSALKN